MASDISDQLRSQVALRAGYRCEYCLISEDDTGFRHQVDHTLSRKHGGASTIENLAYACAPCNRNKGADVATVDPSTGAPLALFNPRRDSWPEHFRRDGVVIAGLTPIGDATVRLLRMNAPERIAERRALRVVGN